MPDAESSRLRRVLGAATREDATEDDVDDEATEERACRSALGGDGVERRDPEEIEASLSSTWSTDSSVHARFHNCSLPQSVPREIHQEDTRVSSIAKSEM